MTLDSFIRLSAVMVLAVSVFGAAASYAQDAETPAVRPAISQPPPSVPRTIEPQQSLPQEAILDSNEVTILRDNYAGKYSLATLENLSKLYWKLGAFDLEDDTAISNYIKINDCKVYTDYVNDDMEWRKIIESMRSHLAKEKSISPVTFQFVLQLHLGRYDPQRGGFPIVDNTGFKDTKRIELDSIDVNKEVCFDGAPIKDYPKSIVILLPDSFTLDFVKLDEHVAQAYILRKKSEYASLPEDVRVKRYERDAYLRLRVSFNEYNGNLRGKGSDVMSIMYGKIDGYEIFEDGTQKRLMLSVDNHPQQTGLMSMPSAEVPQQMAAQPPAPTREAIPADSVIVSPQDVQPVSHSFAQ